MNEISSSLHQLVGRFGRYVGEPSGVKCSWIMVGGGTVMRAVLSRLVGWLATTTTRTTLTRKTTTRGWGQTRTMLSKNEVSMSTRCRVYAHVVQSSGGGQKNRRRAGGGTGRTRGELQKGGVYHLHIEEGEVRGQRSHPGDRIFFCALVDIFVDINRGPSIVAPKR